MTAQPQFGGIPFEIDLQMLPASMKEGEARQQAHWVYVRRSQGG